MLGECVASGGLPPRLAPRAFCAFRWQLPISIAACAGSGVQGQPFYRFGVLSDWFRVRHRFLKGLQDFQTYVVYLGLGLWMVAAAEFVFIFVLGTHDCLSDRCSLPRLINFVCLVFLLSPIQLVFLLSPIL